MTRTLHRIIGVLAMFVLLTFTACAGTESSRSTGTYIDDKTISTKVEAQLASDSLTQAIQVEVETYNGVVQLSGFVKNAESRQRAEQIARSITGVKDVKNSIQLRND